MQYWHRKLQRSVTEIRKSRIGLPNLSVIVREVDISVGSGDIEQSYSRQAIFVG